MDQLVRRVTELGPSIAVLETPGAGLVPACTGVGHKAGRRPIGHVLAVEEEKMQITRREVGEPVYAAGEEGGCGRSWTICEPGAETTHVCSRPAGHEVKDGDLHRCADGCWWSGPDESRTDWHARYLVWSLSKKKWIDAAGSGYVELDQADAAGRFDYDRAGEYCTRHTTKMRHWASTPTWPDGIPMPAIRIAEVDVKAVGAGVRTMQDVIEAAARFQVPGWDDYWWFEKRGEVYDPCR